MPVRRVKHIGEKRLVLHDVVLQQGAQVLGAVGGEQEGVDFQAEVLEGSVGGGKDSDALVSVFEDRGEAGF